MQPTVVFPLFSHKPLKTLMAIVDLRLQGPVSADQLATYTFVDVAIPLRFRQTVALTRQRYVFTHSRGDSPRHHQPAGPYRTGAFNRLMTWQVEHGEVVLTERNHVLNQEPGRNS